MDAGYWTWSEPHKDYYHSEGYAADGSPIYRWASQQQSPAPADYTGSANHQNQVPPRQQSHQHSPSAASRPVQPLLHQQPHNPSSYSAYPSPYSAPHNAPYSSYGMQQGRKRTDSRGEDMPLPVPEIYRQRLPNLIPGTPERGWEEPLDSSYYMRTGKEAHDFFKVGRVFAMLWAEAKSATAARSLVKYPSNATVNTDITVGGPFFRRPDRSIVPGRFGEEVYSQIRRFVIVQVRKKKHFVKACPITTYSKRGTLKRNCYPPEHAVAYFYGTQPGYLPGEDGMTKEPIEIYPSTSAEIMEPASRIRFGRTYPVEWNVKVKDIGRVMDSHMTRLIQYWRDEEDSRDTGASEFETIENDETESF